MDIKIRELINKLESKKKESYSSRELRGRNHMMNRLDRIKDRKMNRKIDLQIKNLKTDKSLLDNYNNTTDILDFLDVKKKKVQKNRGGFSNFKR